MKNGAFFLILILLTSIFVSQAGPVLADSNSNSQNKKPAKGEVLEFNTGTVLQTSSTTVVCHIPPGNPNNKHVIVVGISSLTAHLMHGDTKGECDFDAVPEFSSINIETSSDTLTDAINFMNDIVINTSSDSKLGPAVSEAAQLHKLFAHEDKDVKKEFQKAFLEFIKNLKTKIGKGNNVENNMALNELGKAAIKIQSDLDKEEKQTEIKNKIDLALDLRDTKQNLLEIRNQIAMAQINHNTDNPEFEDLLNQESNHLNHLLISEAKSNGEKITDEKINEIKSKSSVQENHPSPSNNADSNDNHEQKSKNDNKSNGGKSNGDHSNGKSKGKNK